MKIIFFDGYCNLCNGFVDWIFRHDHKRLFQVASLQGESAKKILSYHEPATSDPSTIVYKREGHLYERSTAALLIIGDLGGVWTLAKVLLFIPPILRDAVYIFIARNRYRIWGKSDTCRMPTAEEKNRFLP